MWCESTRAHNTIEIDNLNHSRYRHDCYGSGIKLLATAGGVIIMKALLIIPNLSPHKFQIIKSKGAMQFASRSNIIDVIERPDYFLAIIDQLNSNEAHDYTAWYHLHPNLILGTSSRTRLKVSTEKGADLCRFKVMIPTQIH